jgi:hypothetical protein
MFQNTMAVHVVTVIHRPQWVEEEAGGKREPGGVQGDHQEEGQEEEDRLVHQIGPILLFRRVLMTSFILFFVFFLFMGEPFWSCNRTGEKKNIPTCHFHNKIIYLPFSQTLFKNKIELIFLDECKINSESPQLCISTYTCHFHRHSIIIYKILKKKKIIPANTNINVKEYDFCRV